MSDLNFNDLLDHDIDVMFVETQGDARIRKTGRLVEKIEYWVSLKEYGREVKHYPIVNVFWLEHSIHCSLCSMGKEQDADTVN